MPDLTYTTVDELLPAIGSKMAVYGPAGVGKTMLAATYPNVIYANMEAGPQSLAKKNQLKVFGKARVMPCVTLESLDDLNTFIVDMERPDNPFDLIYLDGASEVADKVLANALKLTNEPRQAYNECQIKMGEVFRTFRDMPKHVVFTFREECRDDMMHQPAMPGKKLGPLITYWFDQIFRMGVGKLDDGSTYRFLQTQPDLQYAAKDRSGALDVIEEPNLTALINKIVS